MAEKDCNTEAWGLVHFFFQDLAHVPSASELNVVDVVGGNTIIKVVITVSCPRLSNQKL